MIGLPDPLIFTYYVTFPYPVNFPYPIILPYPSKALIINYAYFLEINNNHLHKSFGLKYF